MPRRSFLAELFDYVRMNRAWMLAPIIVVLLLAGALIRRHAGGPADLHAVL